MRRARGLIGVLALTLSLATPAIVLAGGEIGTVTINSATVDQAGNVRVSGTVWCSEPMYDVQMNGQVDQVIGRKVTLRAGFSGWWFGSSCNGTTPWEFSVRADSGKFGPGWTTIDVWFQACTDPNDWSTCYAKNGTTRYMKVVRTK